MNIEEKAVQMVATAQVITQASIDGKGYPHPVAMMKIKDEDGTILVSTETRSVKTAHFKANLKAGISRDIISFRSKITMEKIEL